MTLFQALILGIVEGVTEFLPISSTGHLILAGKLFNLPDSNFLKSFEIAIQLGAILSVVVLYWKKVWANKEIWKKVALAFAPTAVLGFIFYKLIKTFLLSSSAVVLWALFLGGLILIVFEWWNKKKIKNSDPGFESISAKKAFLIGIAQSVAMVPGVSRSAATIIGGLALGIGRETIVEFSFLLAVPTMAAATAYDLLKNASSFDLSQLHLLTLSFVVSFLVALASIKWLLKFIKNHTFVGFGIYRVVAALVFWLLVIR